MKLITFQSIFDTPTVKMGKLNEQAQTPDGRMWKYLYATEAITKHMIVTRPALTAVDVVASSTNKRSESVYVTPGTDPSWTEGDYQDHWMLVDEGTGEGQIAKIKDNTGTALELYEDYALSTALTAAGLSDISIVHEPDAEMCPTGDLDIPVQGVAQVTFASADYGWFLIRGIGGVLMDETGTTDCAITPGGDANEGYGMKVATDATLDDHSIVGRCIITSTTTDLANLADIAII